MLTGLHAKPQPVPGTALQLLAVEYECRVNPVWPMPNLQKALKLQKEEGRVLGIVSNAQFYTPLLFPALLETPLAALGFDPGLCVWSYELLEAKPSTRLFERVLETLAQTQGISPEQTLYVGNDRLNDIWPAAQLGCKTALFTGDRRSLRLREQDDRCRSVEPDLIIDGLLQLSRLGL